MGADASPGFRVGRLGCRMVPSPRRTQPPHHPTAAGPREDWGLHPSFSSWPSTWGCAVVLGTAWLCVWLCPGLRPGGGGGGGGVRGGHRISIPQAHQGRAAAPQPPWVTSLPHPHHLGTKESWGRSRPHTAQQHLVALGGDGAEPRVGVRHQAAPLHGTCPGGETEAQQGPGTARPCRVVEETEPQAAAG